ncbi:MAG: phosphodiester glycosidase family protein [Bacteroidota bacterium]
MPAKRTCILLLAMLCAHAAHAQSFPPSRIKMYWKDSNDVPYMTFKNVKKEHPDAVFMTNGGPYTRAHEPAGLYIENGKKLRNLKLQQNPKVPYGIPPQGIFVVEKNRARIVSVDQKLDEASIVFAVQAGPLLVINGKINNRLPKGKITMRNGVGIKKDGTVYFACLKMDYRSFAQHFLNESCITALLLDHTVSESWLPESGTSFGRFGPIIVVE